MVAGLASRMVRTIIIVGLGLCSRSVIGLGSADPGPFAIYRTQIFHGPPAYGLATISQKITITEENAGTPSQNQIREYRTYFSPIGMLCVS